MGEVDDAAGLGRRFEGAGAAGGVVVVDADVADLGVGVVAVVGRVDHRGAGHRVGEVGDAVALVGVPGEPGEVGEEDVEGEGAARTEHAADLAEAGEQVLPAVQVHEHVEGGDDEVEALVGEGHGADVPEDRFDAARGGEVAELAREEPQHARHAVDRGDAVAVLGERDADAAGAGAELEDVEAGHGGDAGCGEAAGVVAVPGDVVPVVAVLEVVELGVLVMIDGAAAQELLRVGARGTVALPGHGALPRGGGTGAVVVAAAQAGPLLAALGAGAAALGVVVGAADGT